MPFEYRLESLLALRASLEDKTLNELAILNGALERARATLRELRSTKVRFVRRQSEDRKVGRVDPEKILAEALYLDQVDADIKTTELTLQKQRELVRLKREELLQKSRERQVLEKLKEKHRERYKKEVDRKEATQAEELFLSRYSKNEAD